MAKGTMKHVTVMESSLRPRSFLRLVSNSEASPMAKKKTKYSRVAVHTGINHSESNDTTVIY